MTPPCGEDGDRNRTEDDKPGDDGFAEKLTDQEFRGSETGGALEVPGFALTFSGDGLGTAKEGPEGEDGDLKGDEDLVEIAPQAIGRLGVELRKLFR